jgi:hypothetical protein
VRLRPATFAAFAVTFSLLGAAGSTAALFGQSAKTRPLKPVRPGCDARVTRTFTTNFLAAFNSGDQERLNRLIAPTRRFRHYTVYGPVGARVGDDARRRSTLIAYLSDRRRHSEQLVLTWFSFARSVRGSASFRFDVLRTADDLALPTLNRGTGAISCPGRPRLRVWNMAPNTEPSVPAPQTYAETCQLAPAWCEIQPTPGGVPDQLRRPLAFPPVRPGDECPVTTITRSVPNSGFHVLGDGPVGPDIFAFGQSLGPGIIRFIAVGDRGWYAAKTLWLAAFSDYRGPVLIRGRQLDGPHKVVMSGDGALLVDPQLGPGDTLNGFPSGLREWPGGTLLRTPGCYAWQVDGTDFSHVIVFEAVFDRWRGLR